MAYHSAGAQWQTGGARPLFKVLLAPCTVKPAPVPVIVLLLHCIKMFKPKPYYWVSYLSHICLHLLRLLHVFLRQRLGPLRLLLLFV